MSALCDFCSAADPEWFYSAGEFAMPEADWGSSGGWTACTSCSDLIERGAWDALARRSVVDNRELVAVASNRTARRVAIREAARLHRIFAARRRGPRRPFG